MSMGGINGIMPIAAAVAAVLPLAAAAAG